MKCRERDIFLCSIANTGTWTLAWNILRVPTVDGMVQVELYRHPQRRLPHLAVETHAIAPDKQITESCAVKGRQLFIRHFHSEPDPDRPADSLHLVQTPYMHYDVMLRMCHGVAPLRDPVESLLTLTHRDNGPGVQEHALRRAIAWTDFVDQLAREPFHCVPIDTDQREWRWQEFLEDAGLESVQGDWGTTNSSGRNDAHSAYSERGDLSTALTLEPQIVGAVNILRANVSKLRPFLEGYGYSNLPWW